MAVKTYSMVVDPSILELLGPSLYTNIYYVLAELVANAYDAQAKNVYIFAEKDSITVEDDGLGMTYEEVTQNYLAVAKVSRENEDDTYTKDGKRRRMGRKGIGKLAALSVSENVLVQTRSKADVSGFVLSRHVRSDNKLAPIPEDKIRFRRITGSGTSVVMLKPEYKLHKQLYSAKKNLARIFPLTGKDFRIHIIRDNEEVVIDKYDSDVTADLCTIITLGTEFKKLTKNVLKGDPIRKSLISVRPTHSISMRLWDKAGVAHKYTLEIKGWIGAYKSTRGRKKEVTDFPDNHISLYANSKLGEFNILPLVGQNRLNEVYVVGELHVDLFEETSLPDMALSNRQGYKTDDERYEAVIAYVREVLLEVTGLRDKWADVQADARRQKKKAEQAAAEEKLKEGVDAYQKAVAQDVESAATKRLRDGRSVSAADIRKMVDEAMNKYRPNMGLKQTVDGLKKRILISHTKKDKDFGDVAYEMLVHNGVAKADIIYTDCDDQEARIPLRTDIFAYLRRFFVESYSTQKIFVLFLTSPNIVGSWGVLAEVGAAWITQSEHQILNIDPCVPGRPLNVAQTWQTTKRDPAKNNALYVERNEADIYCDAIETACRAIGVLPKGRKENLRYLGTLVEIR